MRMSWPIVAISCALLLAGCSGVPTTAPIETSPVSGMAIRGIVHGGQQPISGAHVYLFAAGTGGYGGESQSLLTSGSGKDGSGNYYVTTAGDGSFNISPDYSCPGASSQVYLYSIGGDPTPGVPNAVAGLLAGLGSCDVASFPSLYVVVNEVSTVATAFALAAYAKDATDIGSSSNTQGIANAFGTPVNCTTATPLPSCGIANLESLSTGTALSTTPAGNGTVPQGEINTLADILAACINSSGAITGPTSPTPCYTLFNSAENGGTEPTDTATAAINIAHNPGLNITALYGLLTPDAPFEPTIPQPNDFTIAIAYTGGGLDGSGHAPEGIAVDGSGNVWVPNYMSNSVSEFNPSGTPISSSMGYTAPAGVLDEPTSIAIDNTGNAWIANYSNINITEFGAGGKYIPLSAPYGTGAGLDQPYGIALDKAGYLWVTNFGDNTMSEFEPNGLEVSGSGGYGSQDLVGPAGVASDTSGNLWYVNYTSATGIVGEAVPAPLTMAGTAPTFANFSSSGLSGPYGVAIDGSGNVWVTDRGGSALSEFTCTQQTTVAPIICEAGTFNTFTGGGVDDPYGLAVDGAGNIWTANNGGNGSISEFSSTGTAISGAAGYQSDLLLEPYGIAIDGSGNVWLATDYSSAPLVEFVGAAAPVVTPLAAGVQSGKLGQRP